MPDTPPAAREAAIMAFAKVYNDPGTLTSCVIAALEAATPIIIATEHARIVHLASQLRASIPADHPPGAQASFADYLRQERRP